MSDITSTPNTRSRQMISDHNNERNAVASLTSATTSSKDEAKTNNVELEKTKQNSDDRVSNFTEIGYEHKAEKNSILEFFFFYFDQCL